MFAKSRMENLVTVICTVFAVGACCAQKAAVANAPTNWVGSWATSEQSPYSAAAKDSIDPALLTDATVRQIVHLSVGGTAVRWRLSNAFGTKALTIDSVYLANAVSPGAATIDPASSRAVTFSGKTAVSIPPGAEFVSDVVPMAVAPLGDLAISFHLDGAPSIQTLHQGSRANSYFVHGQHGGDADLPDAKKVTQWVQLAAVDVTAGPGAFAVAVLGDSITDGHGATTDGNDRWTDVLARRLQAGVGTRQIAVLNEGIGGNHLLTDGLGVNALARLDRDVLAQSGVRYVFVLEGINDLGGLSRQTDVLPEQHVALVANMIAAYEQIILRAHAHGLIVIGATLTPYVGGDYYHPAEANEDDRQKVNAWIRTPGHFDAVVDFDAVVRDPAHPTKMLPAADSGDHLHPGPAGYRMMGEAVPLTLFR
jgi:lysophospholipase L1-like esterase